MSPHHFRAGCACLACALALNILPHSPQPHPRYFSPQLSETFEPRHLPDPPSPSYPAPPPQYHIVMTATGPNMTGIGIIRGDVPDRWR